MTVIQRDETQARAQIDLCLNILEKIGEGGMGLIYRVQDLQLKREGALKVLKGDLADEQRIQRFFREARITARLDHPTIPPVYQVGQTVNGDHFILMKLISGRTLQELLFEHHKGSPEALDQRQLLEVLIKVSYAVEYAHQHDIIHRDLKPDNIMVGEFGDVTLMDWGIAKDIQSKINGDHLLLDHPSSVELSPDAALKAGLTEVGSIMGTPGYMSPEQVGDSSNVDLSTDIYALGAMLNEILTGFLPVEGESATNKMINTLKGQLIFPIQRKQGVPIELDSLVRNCLITDQKERLQSASQFIAELSAYLAQEELTVYEYSLSERMKRAAAAHPKFLLSLVFMLSFLSLGLIVALIFKGDNGALAPVNEGLQDKDSRVRQLMKNAEFDAKLGKSESMRRRLKEALEIEKSEALLLKAASLAKQVNDLDLARAFLNELIRTYPPGYKALFELHILELESKDLTPRESIASKKIFELARSRNELDKNDFAILSSQALAAEQNQDYEEALKFHKRAIDLDPKNAWLYVSRASALMKLKRREEALADFSKALELSPTPGNYAGRGQVFSSMKNYDESLQDYNTAIKLNPKFSRAYTNRGLVFLKTKQASKALRDFDQSIKLGAQSVLPYTLRAKVFVGKKDYQSALKTYTVALKVFPESGRLYYLKGDLLRQLQRFDEAIPQLRRASELLDGRAKADAFNLLGFSLNSMNKFQAAIQAYNQALQYNPKLAVAYYSRGVVRLNSGGNKKEVLADLTSCLKLQPDTKKARLERAKVYLSLKQYKEAYVDLTIFVKNFPNDLRGHINLGRVAFQLGHFDVALESSNRSLKLRPTNTELLNFRAQTLFEIGREAEAIAALTEIVRTTPGDVSALFNRSLIYYRRREYSKALKDLNLFEKRAPGDRAFYETRSKVHQALGQYRSAAQDLEKTLKFKPKDANSIRRRIATLKARAP